jgi:hypothetical protein
VVLNVDTRVARGDELPAALQLISTDVDTPSLCGERIDACLTDPFFYGFAWFPDVLPGYPVTSIFFGNLLLAPLPF